MDFEAIKKAAEKYGPDMTKFLRDMIAIPSESCEEKGVVHRIKEEMEKLGYDKVEIDGLGNVIGWMGKGDKIIAIDSHIDTVGIGNINNWTDDPYKGYETDKIIYGRGGSDQEGGMASATYGARIMKDLGLIPEGYKIMVVGSVQEEDCDGMCWQYIYNVDKIVPEFVISTEPTDGGIYRGHRGRMEIRVDVKGVSCHGSAPERGDNAIYKMADILQDVRALNENPADDKVEIKGLVKMLDPEQHLTALYKVFGRMSGRDTDKEKLSGFTPVETPEGGVTYLQAEKVVICRKVLRQRVPGEFMPKEMQKRLNSDGLVHIQYTGEVLSIWRHK